MLWGCFSEAGTEGLREEKHHSENTVQSIQNFRLGRRFTFQQDNDPKQTTRVVIHNAVNVFEWPSQQPLSGLEPNQIFLEKPENVRLPPSDLKELERWRGEEVRRQMADNCQMLMNKACHIKQTKDLRYFSEIFSYEYLCNVLIWVFIFNTFTKLLQFCFCFVNMMYGE